MTDNSLKDQLSILKKAKVGGEVLFGSYPKKKRDDSTYLTEFEPIEWIVLEKKDNKLLLITKYGIEAQPFNVTNKEVTWEDCSLRRWLNGMFYNTAFSTEEQKLIQSTLVYGEKSREDKCNFFPAYPPENYITSDKVFILSATEVKQYFESNEKMKSKSMAKPTAHADLFGKCAIYNTGGRCNWWLRTPGYAIPEPECDFDTDAKCRFSIVSSEDGSVNYEGYDVDNYDDYNTPFYEIDFGFTMVRPVIRITLDSNCYETTIENNLFYWESIYSASEANVGDIINFGLYPKNHVNYKEPIEWYVLAKDDEKMLVVSQCLIDSVPFCRNSNEICWEESDLRDWLNKGFVKRTFSDDELLCIENTQFGEEKDLGDTNDNYGYALSAKKCDQKVFLLSMEEASNFFVSLDERIGFPTEYAKSNDLYTSNSEFDSFDSGSWWLRDRGEGTKSEAVVDGHGYVNRKGYIGNAFGKTHGFSYIRPAMWLNLEILRSNSLKIHKIRDKVLQLLDEASLYLGDGDWERADTYYERVLVLDSRNSQAYLGRLMAKLKIKSKDELGECEDLSENEVFCEKIFRYADENLRRELRGYMSRIEQKIQKRKEDTYEEAKKLFYLANTETEYEEAYSLLQTVHDFKNADHLADECVKGIKTCSHYCEGFETISFGSYPQGENGEVKPIEWIILERKEDKALLISKYALDCQPYNYIRKNTTWAKCTLREWLNREFVNSAFSPKEKKMILKTDVINEYDYGKVNDDLISNKIFLLSLEEAEKYFDSNSKGQCLPTAYAKKRKKVFNDYSRFDWWLRTPVCFSRQATYVSQKGEGASVTVVDDDFYENGIAKKLSPISVSVTLVDDFYGVRPALWMKLEQNHKS